MSTIKTINLKGKEYAPVKERIKAFHETYDSGSIRTAWSTAFEGKDNAIIAFKATIYTDSQNPERSFTGHSIGKINGEKAFEKLETIAVGRALANAGFLADGDVASAEEMNRYFEQGAEVDHSNPEPNQDLPEAVRHLADRYPFDKTLKCPKNDHRPYLNDGSEELDMVEKDIVDGTLDPRFVRYFYTVTNTMWDYLQKIPAQVEMDKQHYNQKQGEQ